jgi:hypothetical protein
MQTLFFTARYAKDAKGSSLPECRTFRHPIPLPEGARESKEEPVDTFRQTRNHAGRICTATIISAFLRALCVSNDPVDCEASCKEKLGSERYIQVFMLPTDNRWDAPQQFIFLTRYLPMSKIEPLVVLNLMP